MNHTPTTALITGAGRGIGRACAHALAEMGLHVALLARSEDQLRQVAAECRERGVQALPLPGDIANESSVTAAVERTLSELGPVEVLVNNAGAFLDKPIVEVELDEWMRVMDVNMTGTFLATRAVLPGMIERETGIILNIASTAAVQGYEGQSAYCASKHAMLGFARALQLEVQEKNIRVHTLCPGGVDTVFIEGTNLGRRLAGQVMIRPEDIAHLVTELVRLPMNVAIPEVVIKRFQK